MIVPSGVRVKLSNTLAAAAGGVAGSSVGGLSGLVGGDSGMGLGHGSSREDTVVQ